jgi:hypothetical protein
VTRLLESGAIIVYSLSQGPSRSETLKDLAVQQFRGNLEIAQQEVAAEGICPVGDGPEVSTRRPRGVTRIIVIHTESVALTTQYRTTVHLTHGVPCAVCCVERQPLVTAAPAVLFMRVRVLQL